MLRIHVPLKGGREGGREGGRQAGSSELGRRGLCVLRPALRLYAVRSLLVDHPKVGELALRLAHRPTSSFLAPVSARTLVDVSRRWVRGSGGVLLGSGRRRRGWPWRGCGGCAAASRRVAEVCVAAVMCAVVGSQCRGPRQVVRRVVEHVRKVEQQQQRRRASLPLYLLRERGR